MSSNKSSKPKFHQILSLVLAALTVIFLVFYGSLPVSYDYEVGSIAGQDIYATRTFADSYETERYIILTVAVFTLSPLLYEILHRIPFVRWCVFGEK